MNKLRNIKNLLLGIILLMTVGMFAQPEKFNRANLLLREKNADLALSTIDSVIAHPDTKNDPASWTLRAFIYFDIYKRTDKLKLYSPLRDTILSSIKKSMSLKPIGDNAADDNASNNKKLLINLSAGYYNLAKTLLQDSINDERSLIAYNKFKQTYLLADSAANFSAKDVEYFLAVGSVYSDIFIKDNKNTKAQNIAKIALLNVLQIQDDNPAANINLGLMYYNQAVNLTKELDYGADLSQIDFVQENIIKLAKQAEQFILKVYTNDNKNVKAVEALHYIYRMLNENAKFEEFKKKGELLGIKFDSEEKTGDGTSKDEKTADDKPKNDKVSGDEKPKEEKLNEVNPK